MQITHFLPDPITNMITIGHSCFWLDDLKKYSLEPLGQMNKILAGNIYGRSSIQATHVATIR